ncbi:MAG: hypothetical protein A2163_01470 [Actinobacteria bacterium RBG_13_35_12]|nr:MAG: hypothetical protein A2163_01470 [Actinobacteria bacterium RBG_13_35_12]
MLFLALLFGYAFFKSFKQFIGLNKLIIMISLISSMIAIFEYLNKGDIFYFIFSGPNLFEQRRPGGIAYSHVEYSFLSLLGFVSSVYLFFISKRKIYMPIALFLLSTSVLSSSKSGFLGFVIYIFFFLIYLLFTKRISLISKIAFVGSSLLLIYFLFINIPYIYRGLVSLLEFDFYSKISIYHRFQDYVVGYKYLTDNIINFLIGYTPLRNYPDTSYIEVSFVNIFFRLGLTGIIIYYFPYIYFSFSKHWLPYMVLFKILALTIVFSDFTANVSENIKLSVLLFTLFGSLLRLKYENKHNYTNL